MGTCIELSSTLDVIVDEVVLGIVRDVLSDCGAVVIEESIGSADVTEVYVIVESNIDCTISSDVEVDVSLTDFGISLGATGLEC